MSTKAAIKAYAGDPAAFIYDIPVVRNGLQTRFGDIAAPFQREWVETVSPALLAVATGQQPACGRYFWDGTKGTAKSTLIAWLVLWLVAFSRKPLTIQIGAADADQAAEPRKAADETLRQMPWLAQRVTIDRWKIACEATGSTCTIEAADVAGSHGARPHVLFLDELHAITKREFAENLMDNASKMPDGLVVIGTNSGVLDTWQWQWRELARTSERWTFLRWAEPAPWLDPAEIAEAERRNTRARYRRLFWGEWSPENEGEGLDSQDVQAAKVLRGPTHQLPADSEAFCGVDIGVKRDFSGMVVLLCRKGSPKIQLALAQSWSPPRGGEVDLSAVERAILDAHRRFRFRLYADPHQASLLLQRLRSRGVWATEMPFTGQKCDQMATTLLRVFRERSIELYDHPQLVGELLKLQIVERAFGYRLTSTRTEAGGHCDLATSMSICLPAAERWAALNASYRLPPKLLNVQPTTVPPWASAPRSAGTQKTPTRIASKANGAGATFRPGFGMLPRGIK